MSTLKVKNWTRYQHYKDRCPPWIKLATDTFQNYEFSRLHDASKLLAICIWTIAARSKDGSVPNDFEYLKRQGALGPMVKPEHLKELINQGFVEICSEVLADCKQTACSEGEGEGETEREAEEETEQSSPRREDASAGTPIVGFSFPCDGKVKSWSLTQELLTEWSEAFPTLDILAECRQAHAWIRAKPENQKTAKGMPAFLVGWFGRSRNKGGNRAPAAASKSQQTIQNVNNWVEKNS